MKLATMGLMTLLTALGSSATVCTLTGQDEADIGPEQASRGVAELARRLSADGDVGVGSTLRMQGRLGHRELDVAEEHETHLLVTVAVGPQAMGSTPARLDLSVVIDCSGSMHGQRLDNALEAAKAAIERLRDGDTVSVVGYSTEAEVLVAPTRIDSLSRERAAQKLRGIAATGRTCISCAVRAAMELLGRGPEAVHHVLLLSDGEATEGVRQVQGYERLAAEVRAQGASISTVGVDVEYSAASLATMARLSNGRHYFVEHAADLPRIFDQELRSLVRTVATDAVLRVEPAPGVELVEVYDRAFRREGDELVVPLGNFSAGARKTLLVRVRVDDGAVGQRAVADLRLSYEDRSAAGEGRAERHSATIYASMMPPGFAPGPLDPVVGGRLCRARTAAALTEANRLFEQGKVRAARRRVAEQLEDLQAQRELHLEAVPPGLLVELEADFDGQMTALEQAEQGFALVLVPPGKWAPTVARRPRAVPTATAAPTATPFQPAAPSPARDRHVEAQMRTNESRSFDMGL